MTATILVFINILLIELILSVDNASVLAVVVNKNLPNQSERNKALRYGILGAYVFRGLSLAFVSYIMYNPSIGAWFKILGGLYLCYLFYTHLTPEADSVEEGNVGFIEKICKKLRINKFWTTVIMVEFLDIVFSIDNLVACVSLSSSIMIVCAAVFLGILGMRFVAKYFSSLLEKYPSLEKSAFVVILILGIKMFLAGVFDFMPNTAIHEILNSHSTDLVFSLVTIGVFAYPIIKSKLAGAACVIVALTMVSCEDSSVTKYELKEKRFYIGSDCMDLVVYELDSCEYIGKLLGNPSDVLTHKGNCKYCKIRNTNTAK